MLSEISARIEAVGAQFLACPSAFGAVELAFKAEGYPASPGTAGNPRKPGGRNAKPGLLRGGGVSIRSWLPRNEI